MGKIPGLAVVAQRAARSARAVRADVKNPPWVPPGHFYSPVPSRLDIERAMTRRREPRGVDFDFQAQRRLARELDLSVPPSGRWQPDNPMFGPADASVLVALLSRNRPGRFIEVGSGHSTALVLDVADLELPELDVLCVEPYADRLRSLFLAGDSDRVRLIEQDVQSIEPETLAAEVRPGDFFFIDSTHVAKPGSDVIHLFLHTLPLLPVGTIVHVHDIFWPFEYPDGWLAEGRGWTEIYMLHALLAHNSDWKVLLFNDWLWTSAPELVPPETVRDRPGSIWLERVAGGGEGPTLG